MSPTSGLSIFCFYQNYPKYIYNNFIQIKITSEKTGDFTALILRTNQLVSPFGRDVAQRQRGLFDFLALTHKQNLSLPSGEMSRSDREGLYRLLSFSGLPDTNSLAIHPLSHLLRKCQLSQRESQEAGANCTPDESREL